jgi:hypothetical protein
MIRTIYDLVSGLFKLVIKVLQKFLLGVRLYLVSLAWISDDFKRNTKRSKLGSKKEEIF